MIDSMYTRVRELWDRGHDTRSIARFTVLREPDVCRVLARIMDNRYQARKEQELRRYRPDQALRLIAGKSA